MDEENFWLNVVLIVLVVLSNIENVRQYFFPKPTREFVELKGEHQEIQATQKEMMKLLKRTNTYGKLRMDGLSKREHKKLISVATNVEIIMKNMDLSPESRS